MVNSLLSVGTGGRVPLTKLRQEALPPRHTQPGCSVPASTRAKSLQETRPSAKEKGTPTGATRSQINSRENVKKHMCSPSGPRPQAALSVRQLRAPLG